MQILFSLSDTATAKIMFIQINIGRKVVSFCWLFKLIKSLTMHAQQKTVVPFSIKKNHFYGGQLTIIIVQIFEPKR